MDSFRFMVGVTVRDSLRTGRVIAWLGVAIVVMLMGAMFSWLMKEMANETLYGQFSLILVYRLQALCAAVFSAAVISQEVEERTIAYLVTRPMARVPMILSRMLGVGLVVTVWSWIFAIFAGLGTMGPSVPSEAAFWRDILILPLGAFAYTALFSLVSLLLNRALIYNLLFAFGWEAFVPYMPGTMYLVSIHTYLAELSIHKSPTAAIDSPSAGAAAQALERHVDNWVALLVLVGVIGLGALASAAWFSNNEYVPREDAE